MALERSGAIALGAVDQSRLDACETVIERGLASFVEVGEALLTIRENRLYRASHSTFEDYCRERWDMNRDVADRTIRSAEVAGILRPIGRSVNEAQARELAPLRDNPGAVVEAWSRTVEETDGRPTARAVREVVRPRVEEAGDRIVDSALSAVDRVRACASLSPRALVIALQPEQRKRALEQAREASAWLGFLIAELERVSRSEGR